MKYLMIHNCKEDLKVHISNPTNIYDKWQDINNVLIWRSFYVKLRLVQKKNSVKRENKKTLLTGNLSFQDVTHNLEGQEKILSLSLILLSEMEIEPLNWKINNN